MDDDAEPYVVVLNDEEQYSIWPADRDLPPGWRAVIDAQGYIRLTRVG